jgi:hypothetical protein
MSRRAGRGNGGRKVRNGCGFVAACAHFIEAA